MLLLFAHSMLFLVGILGMRFDEIILRNFKDNVN